MYGKNILNAIFFQILIAITVPCWAIAEVNLTLTPEGGNVFVLKGSGLKNIAVIDLELSYDAAAMDKPKAAKGSLIDSGSIFDFKPAMPGEMRLFIRDSKKLINGSGTIAVFTFEGINNAEGSITNIRSNLVSAAMATPVMARVQILGRPKQQSPPPETNPNPVLEIASPSPPADQPGITTQTRTVVQNSTPAASNNRRSDPLPQSGSTFAGGTSAQVSSTLGTVMFPSSQPEKETVLPAAPPTETVPPARPAPAHQRPVPEEPLPAAPTAILKSATYQSIPERFRDYKGTKTVQALTELFRPDPGQIIRQEPAVALSDGENQVSLRVELPLNLKETPSFSLRKASMVSILQNNDGSWLITARPSRDTLEARLTVNCDGSEIRFTLTTAPPLKAGQPGANSSLEERFAEYLKLKGTEKDPRPDLNGDGKNDYLDDYIFTANYLASRQNPKPSAAGDKQ
jgi:hypothetical protein